MRIIRLVVYVISSMLGLTKPTPQSLTDIQEFLVDHQADLTTAFVIDTTAFQQMMQETFTLPLLQIYDSTGAQLLQTTGWRSSYGDSIRNILPTAPPRENKPQLWDELIKFRTFEDKIVSAEDLPVATYYFVEYWATWCLPCIYQMEDIHALVQTLEGVEIAVITVNCDLRESLGITEATAIDDIHLTESELFHTGKSQAGRTDLASGRTEGTPASAQAQEVMAE